MKTVVITARPGFEEWRIAAREAMAEGQMPHQMIWKDNENDGDLFFSDPVIKIDGSQAFSVSKQFIDMAAIAVCHSSPERFSLLYKILWRLCHENKNLLQLKTDNDILKLNGLIKAVRRDAYKIKAFLRFREIAQDGQPHFIAWYEPEHYRLDYRCRFFSHVSKI